MRKTTDNMALGMSLGMCFGVALGTAVEKLGIPMGICFGMLIGMMIGIAKDKAVKEQVEKEGYTIKSIEKNDASDDYRIIINNNRGEEQMVNVPIGTMETEQFAVGDIIFMDEDGDIEQAFDEEDE
ncbi:MAG: hypothetical protein Q4B70_16915 [Lachnospiraceae bacterium]|nr:hypothetical protein [Lachnospiraceae bacterium]